MEMSFILFAVRGMCQLHTVVEDRSQLYTKVSLALITLVAVSFKMLSSI